MQKVNSKWNVKIAKPLFFVDTLIANIGHWSPFTETASVSTIMDKLMLWNFLANFTANNKKPTSKENEKVRKTSKG